MPVNTAEKWLQSGKGGLGCVIQNRVCREEHVWFYEEVTLALAEVEGNAVDAWMEEVKRGNWQAARDFLARRFKKRWGKSQHRAIEVRSAAPTEIQLVLGDDDQPCYDGVGDQRAEDENEGMSDRFELEDDFAA